ncbi:MAG: hypothetical protein MR658_03935 [Campylobacter sp.]|nr:hypothetical protein [Campylobacter sp.]MCI6177961.1 hypothetical protein [Campylobacter sp.]MDD7091569.1 hypothetical protein [Campylobacteraceae bacterium]MDY4013925.1 hypothetical protein [Campylobacter sp.]MDY5285788.1 hypothetical protein [Campylobacter sp.]
MKKRVLSLSVVCAALLGANEQKLDEIVVSRLSFSSQQKARCANKG